MRGSWGRILLALAMAVFVVALVAGLGRGTQRVAVPNGLPDAPMGATSAATALSPAKTVGYARPHLIPPLRTIKPAPFKYQPVPEELESYPPRAPGSSTVDGAVQRNQTELKPTP